MKSILVCLFVAFALSGVALAALFGGPATAVAAAFSGAGLAFAFNVETTRRDARLRALVVAAYGAGVDAVRLKDLSLVLPTRDVTAARTAALKAEAELMAARYANGDSSDY